MSLTGTSPHGSRGQLDAAATALAATASTGTSELGLRHASFRNSVGCNSSAARGTPAPTLIIATRNRSPECGAASSRMRSRELTTQFGAGVGACAGHRGQRAARNFCRLSTAPSASLKMFWSSLAFPKRCAPASQRPPCTLSTQAMLISWIRKSWLQQLLSHFPAAPAPLGLLAATAPHDPLHLL